MSPSFHRARRARRRAVVTLAVAGLAAAGTVATASASTFGSASASSAAAVPTPPLDPQALHNAIANLPNSEITGALIKVSGPSGQWSGTSGIGDLATGAGVRSDDRFRIGSVTKVFTATVALQLVAENRVDLSQTIQHYLPGLFPEGYPPVTIAELLNHTSGLPAAGNLPMHEDDPAWFVQNRFKVWTPQQVVTAALTNAGTPANPMDFAPGTAQRYNGLNYYLLGMLIEKVTGDSYSHQVQSRILRPLHLTATSVPDLDDPRIPGPHLHGYLTVGSAGGLADVSDQSPYPWAEGGMISDASDLTRVLTMLTSGHLLPPAETKLLFTVPNVPYRDATHCDMGPAAGRACFSMGLMSVTMPNGVVGWGKTGSRPGYTDGVFVSSDLQRTIAYAYTPTDDGKGGDTAFLMGIAAAAFDPAAATGTAAAPKSATG
ncbi:serine hydrolase domain-containing protein [Catenulispora pinisilvae]|uniref:serine hydrolase domain-containing protein n=1 Tax=Catenulispora pinisilvae TaxID=2705253 RepID=UPI00189241FF|nr:serine hydrolase domain-containing protein [Catenulispora pinisilvae]